MIAEVNPHVPYTYGDTVVAAAADGQTPPVEPELRRWDNGAGRIVGGMLAAAVAVRSGSAGTPTVAALDRALSNLDVAPFLRAVVARLAATAA